MRAITQTQEPWWKKPLHAGEREFMESLYGQARGLVVKHQKATAIFLQRQLIIDLFRAERLLAQLEADGVVGKERADGTRQIFEEKQFG